jgi:hypothetical protein
MIKNHENYLGLTSFVGRSKSTSFGELKGRVWKKINGWKEKFLSHGGREVLIKAVAQSYDALVLVRYRVRHGYGYGGGTPFLKKTRVRHVGGTSIN